jgi:hypothetical protein
MEVPKPGPKGLESDTGLAQPWDAIRSPARRISTGPACGSAGLGTPARMKLMRTATILGIARTVYTQARKPENQARIKQAVAAARARRGRAETTPSR